MAEKQRVDARQPIDKFAAVHAVRVYRHVRFCDADVHIRLVVRDIYFHVAVGHARGILGANDRRPPQKTP